MMSYDAITKLPEKAAGYLLKKCHQLFYPLLSILPLNKLKYYHYYYFYDITYNTRDNNLILVSPLVYTSEFSNTLLRILLLFVTSPRSTLISWRDILNPLILTRQVPFSISLHTAFLLMGIRGPRTSSGKLSLCSSVDNVKGSSKTSVFGLEGQTCFSPQLPPCSLQQIFLTADCLGLCCSKSAYSAFLRSSSIAEGWCSFEDFLCLVCNISTGLVLRQ